MGRVTTTIATPLCPFERRARFRLKTLVHLLVALFLFILNLRRRQTHDATLPPRFGLRRRLKSPRSGNTLCGQPGLPPSYKNVMGFLPAYRGPCVNMDDFGVAVCATAPGGMPSAQVVTAFQRKTAVTAYISTYSKGHCNPSTRVTGMLPHYPACSACQC